MELVALIFLIVVLTVVQSKRAERRENALADRLQKVHEAGLAAREVDAVLSQTKRETAFLRTLSRHD